MNNIEKMKEKIVELEKQLEIKDSEIASLKRQLDLEKNKPVFIPSIPQIWPPWYTDNHPLEWCSTTTMLTSPSCACGENISCQCSN